MIQISQNIKLAKSVAKVGGPPLAMLEIFDPLFSMQVCQIDHFARKLTLGLLVNGCKYFAISAHS